MTSQNVKKIITNHLKQLTNEPSRERSGKDNRDVWK